MRQAALILAGLLGLYQAVAAAEPKAIFQDTLKGKLGEGWTWLREHSGHWRLTAQGLEIQVEPGVADTVKNALVRQVPDRGRGKYAIEVTVESLAAPTQQYEQGGLTWYQGSGHPFKLVHELVDGKTYIIPGRQPTATRLVQLRLVVDKETFTAQYRLDAKGAWQTSATGKLPPGPEGHISIQCYNGPPAAEHWIRFSDFRIVEVP